MSLIQQCYCLIAISEAISSTMAKFETAKDIRFSIVNCFWHLMRKTLYHLDRVNSIETNLGTNQFIIYRSVMSFDWTCHIQMAKSFSDKMLKNVHICKRIYLSISTFVIIEKMPLAAAVCRIFFCLLDFLTYFDWEHFSRSRDFVCWS